MQTHFSDFECLLSLERRCIAALRANESVPLSELLSDDEEPQVIEELLKKVGFVACDKATVQMKDGQILSRTVGETMPCLVQVTSEGGCVLDKLKEESPSVSN